MPELAPEPISLSIVYEPVERGWVQARIEGIPQVITAVPDEGARRVSSFSTRSANTSRQSREWGRG